jgi:hypothetical protein
MPYCVKQKCSLPCQRNILHDSCIGDESRVNIDAMFGHRASNLKAYRDLPSVDEADEVSEGLNESQIMTKINRDREVMQSGSKVALTTALLNGLHINSLKDLRLSTFRLRMFTASSGCRLPDQRSSCQDSHHLCPDCRIRRFKSSDSKFRRTSSHSPCRKRAATTRQRNPTLLDRTGVVTVIDSFKYNREGRCSSL